MADFFNGVLAKPVPAVAVLGVAGIGLGFVGLGTVSAALFGLAGLLIMFVSGRGASSPE